MIDGRSCHLHTRGESDTAFLLGISPGEGEYARRVFDFCCGATQHSFTLLAYECADWDSAYSPWPALVGTPAQMFGGRGEETLAWLTGACADQQRAQGIKKFFTVGYSLAGLFALYAFYESSLFSGAIACSSSLWYPGFMEYLKSRRAPEGSLVYLSLGGKEERSAPDYMKSVGENTRALNRLLKQDRNIASTTLVMNPGGHFAPSEPRLAKGIVWTLERA